MLTAILILLILNLLVSLLNNRWIRSHHRVQNTYFERIFNSKKEKQLG